jgi:hypothetical protein
MTPATARIRALNDTLRRTHLDGLLHLTPGLVALGLEMIMLIDEAVASFEAFTPENDPHGEHDFGIVTVRGHTILFKIDYYDLDMHGASPDPADPTVTRRVMTLMLAEEY